MPGIWLIRQVIHRQLPMPLPPIPFPHFPRFPVVPSHRHHHHQTSAVIACSDLQSSRSIRSPWQIQIYLLRSSWKVKGFTWLSRPSILLAVRLSLPFSIWLSRVESSRFETRLHVKLIDRPSSIDVLRNAQNVGRCRLMGIWSGASRFGPQCWGFFVCTRGADWKWKSSVLAVWHFTKRLAKWKSAKPPAIWSRIDCKFMAPII